MKTIALFTALPLLAWPLMANQKTEAPSKLVQVQADGASALQPGTTGSTFDAKAWTEALGQADLDGREKAFDRLIAEAQSNQDLAEWISSTAKGQGELAWTARLALKSIPLQRFPGSSQPFFAPFSADPFGLGADFGDPFAELDRMFQRGGLDLRDWLQQPQPQGAPGIQSQSSGESISIQSGPDGVKVEVRTNENGNEDVKVFEGETMESLLEQYPELKDKVGTTPSMPDVNQLFQRSHPLLQRTPPKQMLGVYLDSRDLKNGRLRVAQVQPGSLADQLGVRTGDELLKLNDQPLGSREDIANGLRDHESGTSMTLRILGSDGEERDLKSDV